MGPGPGEGSLAPAPGGRGGLFGATLAAAAAAETAAVTEEEAESLAMAAVDRMTTAPEAPRGTVKLVRGTRNMAARERRKGDELFLGHRGPTKINTPCWTNFGARNFSCLI